MPYRDLMKEHYVEITNLTALLSTMVNSYRLLIGGANELNNIAEVKKSQVKVAVERADDLGDVIDDLIKTIEDCSGCYTKYCKIKKQYIDSKINKDIILTEVDYELDFDNSQREKEN